MTTKQFNGIEISRCVCCDVMTVIQLYVIIYKVKVSMYFDYKEFLFCYSFIWYGHDLGQTKKKSCF